MPTFVLIVEKRPRYCGYTPGASAEQNEHLATHICIAENSELITNWAELQFGKNINTVIRVFECEDDEKLVITEIANQRLKRLISESKELYDKEVTALSNARENMDKNFTKSILDIREQSLRNMKSGYKTPTDQS